MRHIRKSERQGVCVRVQCFNASTSILLIFNSPCSCSTGQEGVAGSLLSSFELTWG